MPLDHGVGAVAHHGQHALVAKGLERGLIGRRADHRMRIELEVAGVQDRAVLGADDQRLRLRHGVGDTQELQAERPYFEMRAWLDDRDLGLALQPGFAQLAAQDGGGKWRGEDRAAELTPEMGDGAKMVFVGVGDDEANEAVTPFGDERRVGHHDLDLRVFSAAKADAAIDGEPAPVAAIKVEVHADLARPAQWQEGQIVR